MKVALLGGTGFVGSYLVEQLTAEQHSPVLLVRPGSEDKVVDRIHCNTIAGTVAEEEAVRKVVKGCDAVVYNIGILREFPSRGITFEALQFEGVRCAIQIAIESGVKRFLLMSANGVKQDGTPYQRTKHRAEQLLAESPLVWTIFRPSVVFGDPRGKNEIATELRDQLINSPFPAPLFYDGLLPMSAGRFAMAPVHVQDVTGMMVQSLTMPETVGQRYTLCGPETIEWREIIRRIAQAVGRSKMTVPVPLLFLKPLAALLERFESFPLTRDQLTMLLEGNAGDSTNVFKAFEVQPAHFDENSLAYLRTS